MKFARHFVRALRNFAANLNMTATEEPWARFLMACAAISSMGCSPVRVRTIGGLGRDPFGPLRHRLALEVPSPAGGVNYRARNPSIGSIVKERESSL
jgi:hypothetical protein